MCVSRRFSCVVCCLFVCSRSVAVPSNAHNSIIPPTWEMLDCSRSDVGDLDDPNNSGPLGIDYIEFYCDHDGHGGGVVLLFLGWVVFLIYVMGGTAKNYFSPTLGAICEKLKISYNVAGVYCYIMHVFRSKVLQSSLCHQLISHLLIIIL